MAARVSRRTAGIIARRQLLCSIDVGRNRRNGVGCPVHPDRALFWRRVVERVARRRIAFAVGRIARKKPKPNQPTQNNWPPQFFLFKNVRSLPQKCVRGWLVESG